MKTLEDFKKDYSGYEKISHSGGSIITCILYNPITNDTKFFNVDDYEYEYGRGLIDYDYDLQTLEYIRYSMPLNSKLYNQYQNSKGIVTEDCTVTVFKGKKYPIGLSGKVKSIEKYTIPNTYNKGIVYYAILETGEKINIDNLKVKAG